jgi:hypothetical protein
MDWPRSFAKDMVQRNGHSMGFVATIAENKHLSHSLGFQIFSDTFGSLLQFPSSGIFPSHH